MWKTVVVFVYLAVLGIRDIRKRSVPLIWLLAGVIPLAGLGMWKCVQEQWTWLEFFLGSLPGILLLLAAGITRKAGYADGMVLTGLGLYYGYRECALLLCLSLLLLSVVSMLLLSLHRVSRNTRMPYLPFLFIACLLQRCLTGL